MAKKNSANDIDLFRHSIGKIKPVVHDKITPINRLPKRHVTKLKSTTEIDNPKDFSVPISELIASETSFAFTRSGIQPKQLKKLRTGKLPYQAECDLHNLTQQQAEETLASFIHHCHQQGCRVVHIVHGKGKHSGNAHPILKNLVNQRLREFRHVLAFCSALPKDGGAGATYALLKN